MSFRLRCIYQKIPNWGENSQFDGQGTHLKIPGIIPDMIMNMMALAVLYYWHTFTSLFYETT